MTNGPTEKQAKNMNEQFPKEEVKECEKIFSLTRNQGNVSENQMSFYSNQI